MKTKKFKQKARIVVRDKYPKSTNNYRKMHGKATRRGEANRDHIEDAKALYNAELVVEGFKKLGHAAKEILERMNIFNMYVKGE